MLVFQSLQSQAGFPSMATLHALPFSLQSQVGFPSLEATLLGANANIIHIIDMDTSRCFPMPPFNPWILAESWPRMSSNGFCPQRCPISQSFVPSLNQCLDNQFVSEIMFCKLTRKKSPVVLFVVFVLLLLLVR